MDEILKKSPSMLRITDDTLVLILAGGRGSRLYELTDKRAKPAVYFGGSCRIIDFALSNCINSNLNRIGVVTQYMAHSLLRHLQHGWSFLPRERNEFVDMLPARQQLDDSTWYRGTADAVYQNSDIMKNHYRPKYVLILAGDHIYKMNYAQMLLDHVSSGAKCTVGCIEVEKEKATEFGVMAVNENLQVTDFIEKPTNPPTMKGRPDTSLASMGIYVFDADYLYDILEREFVKPESSHDFGKDIIPQALKEGVLYAHPFSRSCMGRNPEGEIYWRDVGTLDAFWEANIDLVTENPQLDIFDQRWPIRSNPKQTFPSKFFYKHLRKTRALDNSIVAGGCIINDAIISNSVLFDNVVAEEGSQVEYSVILPEVTIGKNAVIKRAIIDRHCVIPEGMEIGVDLKRDAERFRVSKGGVVLVTERMLRKLQPSEAK
ncbi:glucose-1-phosphate adenylyltransferase [Pasteurellaceae bacterium TAE3-ERU1]|nr:glucose-1-phosphate adenylyltransferase [Pasteurellaceae bacterium TAE3-ERU1]